MSLKFIVLAFACIFYVGRSSTFRSSQIMHAHRSEEMSSNVVDEQLYSRQLFVYGRSAQQRLLSSHVLVAGEGSTTIEILKNLALAGVGHITIVSGDIGSDISLKGSTVSLLDYARALNPQIRVSRVMFNASLLTMLIVMIDFMNRLTISPMSIECCRKMSLQQFFQTALCRN